MSAPDTIPPPGTPHLCGRYRDKLPDSLRARVGDGKIQAKAFAPTHGAR